MMKKAILAGSTLVLVVSVLSRTTIAQDSPAIRELLDKTKATAGSEWNETFDFFCAMNPTRANRPDDPVIEPAKVLDNLYVIGRTSTAVWAVTTSAGIVLIDAGS